MTDLIAELRQGDGNGCKHANDVMRRAADALEAVTAERDEALAVIAEVLVVPNEFEWDVPPTARYILSRIHEHPKED